MTTIEHDNESGSRSGSSPSSDSFVPPPQKDDFTTSKVRTKEESNNPVANKMYEDIKQKIFANLPEEERTKYQRLGEKFHSSFNVGSGTTYDLSTINMEEAVAYVVESLKSGLHPPYLTEDEKVLLESAYGTSWYTQWGYQDSDLV